MRWVPNMLFLRIAEVIFEGFTGLSLFLIALHEVFGVGKRK